MSISESNVTQRKMSCNTNQIEMNLLNIKYQICLISILCKIMHDNSNEVTVKGKQASTYSVQRTVRKTVRNNFIMSYVQIVLYESCLIN